MSCIIPIAIGKHVLRLKINHMMISMIVHLFYELGVEANSTSLVLNIRVLVSCSLPVLYSSGPHQLCSGSVFCTVIYSFLYSPGSHHLSSGVVLQYICIVQLWSYLYSVQFCPHRRNAIDPGLSPVSGVCMITHSGNWLLSPLFALFRKVFLLPHLSAIGVCSTDLPLDTST
jgi:hypothetical protein